MRDARVTTIGAALLAAAVTSCSTASRDTNESAGEVIASSTSETTQTRPVRWLTDANVLSLLSMMNSLQIAAADVELEAWHVDNVRALAAAAAREHGELQHAVDSVAQRIHAVPVAPALAQTVSAAMQPDLDVLRRSGGRTVDRAFVRQQIVSAQLMEEYLDELAAVTEHHEVRSLLGAARDSVAAQLTRTTAQQARFALADSVAADSAAKAAARLAAKRERRGLPRHD